MRIRHGKDYKWQLVPAIGLGVSVSTREERSTCSVWRTTKHLLLSPISAIFLVFKGIEFQYSLTSLRFGFDLNRYVSLPQTLLLHLGVGHDESRTEDNEAGFAEMSMALLIPRTVSQRINAVEALSSLPQHVVGEKKDEVSINMLLCRGCRAEMSPGKCEPIGGPGLPTAQMGEIHTDAIPFHGLPAGASACGSVWKGWK